MRSRLAPPVLVALALLLAGAPGDVRAAAGSDLPAGAGSPAAPSSVDEVRAELAALAVRIEALKREVAAGRAGRTQLQPLLARAQDLAAQLERMQPSRPVPPAGPASPDAQELRERADALRDRADRLARALGPLDHRIGEVRRRTRLEESLESVGGAGEVLAESAPRRVPTPRSGGPATASGTSGASVPTTAGPSSGSTGPTAGSQPPPPSTNPSSPTTPSPASVPGADPGVRALSVPPPRDVEPLLPSPADSLQELLRKRARVQGDVSTLRSQAQALEAEAIRAENVR